jgi:hypothetical protein
MDFFNIDPNIRRVPPGEMRLVDIQAQPDPTGKTIRVKLEITPFEKSPYIDLFLHDSQGTVAASTSIIEPAGWKMELVLHPRQTPLFSGDYRLSAVLYHPDFGEIDYRKITFSVHVGTP